MKEKVISSAAVSGRWARPRVWQPEATRLNLRKQDKPGGRAYVYEQDGFKFDGGPTVITAPFMFDDIFAAAGRKREEYVGLLRSTRSIASSTTRSFV